MIDWLVGTLLATSALMLLVLAVREPVRRQFGAPVAYALWLIPAARFLVPTVTRTIERPVPAAAPAEIESLVASAAAAPLPPLAEPTLFAQLGGWPVLLLACWLGGAALMIGSGWMRYRRQRRVALDGAVQLCRIGGIRLVRSPAVRGPIAFGIIDRVIAVPEDFDSRFDPAERRLTLDHELHHHRCGDLVANHIAFVLLSLQWFNPLAWVSHNAFRFDQEAACDARVLDKARPRDRADYGRAIAKAASGRALLFASALDQPSTLHRRLLSMLTKPTPARRTAGKILVLGALAVLLPLTATRAIAYVDGPAPTPPAPPVAPVAPAALAPLAPAAAQVAPVAPVAPLPPLPPQPRLEGSKVVIDGKEYKWSELSPAQRAKLRASLDDARRGLAATHLNRAQMRAELQAAMADFKANQADMRRDLEAARREVGEAMREIDRNAAELRRHGQDPEALKAQVRASLKAVEAIDIEAITRNAMAGIDPAMIERSLDAAEEGMRRAEAAIEAAERDDRD